VTSNISSNKLAIHARRVTVMPQDVRLLRDLWQMIDPSHPIAKLSAESVNSLIMATQVDEAIKKRSRATAVARREWLKASGRPIPASLDHYCRDLMRDGNGDWVRTSKGNYRVRFLN
jgi:hypothetical protein